MCRGGKISHPEFKRHRLDNLSNESGDDDRHNLTLLPLTVIVYVKYDIHLIIFFLSNVHLFEQYMSRKDCRCDTEHNLNVKNT